MGLLKLTEENYYSVEANKQYLSNSQYKDFCGCHGFRGCEEQALAKINGEWVEEDSTALLVGSYVDAYFEGTLDIFIAKHPEIMTKKGELKAEYKHANTMIERCERDPKFMQFMSGEKQVIMTGVIGGAPFKIKIDSYHPGVCIVDLKTTQSITKAYWVADLGKVSFVEAWGYDFQLAAYQEIVRQNTGKKLPVYIAAVSKEKEPDIEIIGIDQNRLDEALSIMENNIPRILALKNGEQEPDRCGLCDYCKHTKVLTGPIHFSQINLDI